jgi:hypothetical protein
VEVGGTVEEGVPVCLIEVMKRFTSIYADRAARIVSIPSVDGQFVEYGQTLFLVEPEWASWTALRARARLAWGALSRRSGQLLDFLPENGRGGAGGDV